MKNVSDKEYEEACRKVNSTPEKMDELFSKVGQVISELEMNAGEFFLLTSFFYEDALAALEESKEVPLA